MHSYPFNDINIHHAGGGGGRRHFGTHTLNIVIQFSKRLIAIINAISAAFYHGESMNIFLARLLRVSVVM